MELGADSQAEGPVDTIQHQGVEVNVDRRREPRSLHAFHRAGLREAETGSERIRFAELCASILPQIQQFGVVVNPISQNVQRGASSEALPARVVGTRRRGQSMGWSWTDCTGDVSTANLPRLPLDCSCA